MTVISKSVFVLSFLATILRGLLIADDYRRRMPVGEHRKTRGQVPSGGGRGLIWAEHPDWAAEINVPSMCVVHV